MVEPQEMEAAKQLAEKYSKLGNRVNFMWVDKTKQQNFVKYLMGKFGSQTPKLVVVNMSRSKITAPSVDGDGDHGFENSKHMDIFMDRVAGGDVEWQKTDHDDVTKLLV